MSRFSLLITSLLASLLVVAQTQAASLALDKSSKVTVTIGNSLSVDLYADSREGKQKNYYYVPSQLRVAANSRGRPQLTILTYLSDGSGGESGGTFNAMVTWSLTEREENQVKQKLRSISKGARMLGAAPLESVTTGASVAVIVALGGDEQVAYSGTAPLSSGGKAALAANLSAAGAVILDAGISSEANMGGISVEMNFLLPFRAELGNCTVVVDWDNYRNSLDIIDFTQRKGGQGAFQNSWNKQNENRLLFDIASDNGWVTNSCDYDKANQQQQQFFEDAIAQFLESALASTEVAKLAADEAQQTADEEDEDKDEPMTGGDWDRYFYTYVKNVVTRKSGQQKYRIDRSIVVRDPVSVVGNVKDWVSGNENSPGVSIKSVNITDAEFTQRPVTFTLGDNAIQMFGIEDGVKAKLNSVAVKVTKDRGTKGGKYSDFHVFTKKEVSNGELSHTFEYARGSVSDWAAYQYAVTFAFVGQQPREGLPVQSDAGTHQLEVDAFAAQMILQCAGDVLEENNILGVTAEARYRFLGKDKQTSLTVYAGDDARSEKRLFIDNDVSTIAYRLVFVHSEHGKLAGPWEVESGQDEELALFCLIPMELRSDDPGYVQKAHAAVNGESDRKLDDVLSEFDKL